MTELDDSVKHNPAPEENDEGDEDDNDDDESDSRDNSAKQRDIRRIENLIKQGKYNFVGERPEDVQTALCNWNVRQLKNWGFKKDAEGKLVRVQLDNFK